MAKKWHKNCGGKVIYQRPETETGFKEAGKCLKCGEFPIMEEDIIFEIDSGKVERLYEDKWKIVTKDILKEDLEV